MSKNNNTQKIVGLGLFTAIVIVLQLMGSFIKSTLLHTATEVFHHVDTFF